MRKNKYIMPAIEVAEMDAEELLQAPTISGGGDKDFITTDSKRTIFASFDLDEPEDNWGDIWADETEEY